MGNIEWGKGGRGRYSEDEKALNTRTEGERVFTYVRAENFHQQLNGLIFRVIKIFSQIFFPMIFRADE